MFHSKKQKKNASKRKNNNISTRFNKTKSTKGPSVEVQSQESVEYHRHQSQCRLKAAWADIIKRYKDISAEETDVIDLATEEVVVDRGILQNDTVRYVGTLSNLHTSKLNQEDADDDTVWQPDPNLYENYDNFEKRVSLRKRNNKTNDNIIKMILKASNESFECTESESNESSCYEESSRNVINMEETFEASSNNDTYSKEESLETTDEKLDSEIALSVNTTTLPLQSTTRPDQRRLRVYSFNTFDSGHDSEFYDSDDEEMCAQQESSDYFQQETIDLTLNYYQVGPIDFSQQETFELAQKIPPIALTQEQQRLWLGTSLRI